MAGQGGHGRFALLNIIIKIIIFDNKAGWSGFLRGRAGQRTIPAAESVVPSLLFMVILLFIMRDHGVLRGRARQLIIALGSTIPGYWFTVATVEYMGRIPIQARGKQREGGRVENTAYISTDWRGGETR